MHNIVRGGKEYIDFHDEHRKSVIWFTSFVLTKLEPLLMTYLLELIECPKINAMKKLHLTSASTHADCGRYYALDLFQPDDSQFGCRSVKIEVSNTNTLDKYMDRIKIGENAYFVLPENDEELGRFAETLVWEIQLQLGVTQYANELGTPLRFLGKEQSDILTT